jgi:alpha-1,6-mannosyltransferase
MSFKKVEVYLYAVLYLLGIILLGYFFPRTATIPLFLIYAACFIFYWQIFRLSSDGFDWKKALVLALLLRGMLLFSTPSWSEDYARFLWDGHLVAEGFNPYSHTPTEVRQELQLPLSSSMDELYALMNSPEYHSVYPPSHQLVFWLAASLSQGEILSGLVAIRLVLLAFEILAIYFIHMLLRLFRQPPRNLLLYTLNPLVIMEVIGNLHFEGMMLTMILAGIYFMKKKEWAASGAFLAGAAAVKLSPLMLFPAFLKRVPGKATWRFGLAAGLVVMLTLGPLLYGWPGFSQSLNLYNNNFEFNASIYYLLRQLGYWITGYNTIGILGPALKVLTLIVIVFISLRKTNKDTQLLLETLLLVYWVYLLLNTVVHPWYIIPAIGISVLTEKRAFIVWSLLIVLSYQAYQHQPYAESTWCLFLEYGVLGWVLWKESRLKSGAMIRR